MRDHHGGSIAARRGPRGRIAAKLTTRVSAIHGADAHHTADGAAAGSTRGRGPDGRRPRLTYPVTGVGEYGCTFERAASRATRPDALSCAVTRSTATPATARARADEPSAHDTVSTPAFFAVALAVQPSTPLRTPATDTRPDRFTRTVATIRDPLLMLADRIRITGRFAFVDGFEADDEAAGVAFTALDAGPAPAALFATTVNEYSVPFVRRSTTQEVAGAVAVQVSRECPTTRTGTRCAPGRGA